ncbi:hypothetical protein N658DRAFT_39813 [Parathielavia hyrcaniae]|uniref:C2H2-type domain-containing protein n=1 Tax=Parathielavia hyrcaniae TaxID=113614 RepID=A0AAN6Q4Y5_9PEZI|nr:hypothetical protein N658DRAFT_39813 [Parathielavia hyrcaniae]
MAYHGLPTWHISLELNEDVGGFDFNTPLPAGSTAGTSGSFYAPSDSSYAPSSYGSLTPTSGRSTPSFSASFDLGFSFSSSSMVPVSYELTPPSSTTSTSSPVSPESDSFYDSAYQVFPTTPSRQPGFLGPALGTPGSQLTPSQPMDYLVSQLASQSFTPAPSALTRFDYLPNTSSLQWQGPGSPISFDRQSPAASASSNGSRVKQEPGWKEADSMEDMSTTTARRRALLAGARQRTTALRQQVEQWLPTRPRVRVKRERKARLASSLEDGGPSMATVAHRGPFKCIFGCKEVYQRKEHMMRHVKVKHDAEGRLYTPEAEKVFLCKWCPHRANRLDNLLSHINLHTRKKPLTGGNKRVDYVPSAVLEYEQLKKEIQRRRKPASKSAKRSKKAAV